MNKLLTIGSLALLAMAAAPAALVALEPAATATYKIDNTHSTAVFRLTHLNVGAAWGRVNDPQGTFSVTDSGLNVDVALDVSKVDTDNAKRDDHLRGPDFFNAKQFPQMTFKSTSSKKLSDSAFEVTGDLTIKGTTKPITVTMNKIGEGKDPWGNYRFGVETEFTINRLDYGVSYMPEGLGKDVKIFIALEGVRQ
jgi:polyisoprenoid-binding protein YceI